MSEEKARDAGKQIKSMCPHAHEVLVQHLKELQSTADQNLRYALDDTLLRQNQGRSQLIEELLKTLNI